MEKGHLLHYQCKKKHKLSHTGEKTLKCYLCQKYYIFHFWPICEPPFPKYLFEIQTFDYYCLIFDNCLIYLIFHFNLDICLIFVCRIIRFLTFDDICLIFHFNPDICFIFVWGLITFLTFNDICLIFHYNLDICLLDKRCYCPSLPLPQT